MKRQLLSDCGITRTVSADDCESISDCRQSHHRPNTYAAPGELLLGAPATMVVPLMPMELPMRSADAPSDAVASA
jgi:hypothetical protein